MIEGQLEVATKDLSAQRSVVSRRTSGLGDCLVSLASAWYYAKVTGRTLIVDWRNSRYSHDPERNVFTDFFEATSEIDGVPVICDSSVNSLASRQGILDRQSWAQVPGFRTLGRYRDERVRLQQVKLIKSGRDVAEQIIVMDGCLPVEPASADLIPLFLSYIRPQPAIQRIIDKFTQMHLVDKKIIALHVRHGNGGNIMAHAKFWTDPEEAVSRICRRINQAQQLLGGDSVTLVCTDSAKTLEQIDSRVSGVIAYEKYFRQTGKGELHSPETKYESEPFELGRDAVVEMLLLSHADVLICYPPDSYFSFYARRCGHVAQIAGIPFR